MTQLRPGNAWRCSLPSSPTSIDRAYKIAGLGGQVGYVPVRRVENSRQRHAHHAFRCRRVTSRRIIGGDVQDISLRIPGKAIGVRREALHSRCANEYTEEREAWVPSAFRENIWRARLLDSRTFVARLAGPSARRVAWFADVLTDGYIDMFYVAYWCAGRGVARALMEEIHQRALDMKTARLYSDVRLTAQPIFTLCGCSVEEGRQVMLGCLTLENARRVKPFPPDPGARSKRDS